ncbi:hypothetical protein CPB84DRAFT_1852618 [Gymnopilus junonius]|uniref:Uncharacterized protein n=1 Tax=Gymnopilus junonius TaxID=109634 RepID=A0A9P5THA8_GYMJU|nr:hypothetical protein CPB84DRAFT_1852618 [Gymnopilus junonius]
MPHKKPIHQSPKAKHYAYTGCLFCYDIEKPFFSPFIAWDDNRTSLLRQTHQIFKDRVVNAKIYNFTIYLWEGCKSHPFQISCKKPVIGLERNAVLRKLGVQWRGNLYVLRIGKRNPLYPVDMRGKDAKWVSHAVKKFLAEVEQALLEDAPTEFHFRRW